MPSDVHILPLSVDTLRSLLSTSPGVHVSAYVPLDRLDELPKKLIANPPGTHRQDGVHVFISPGITRVLRDEPSEDIAFRLDPDRSNGDRPQKTGGPSRLRKDEASLLDVFDRVDQVVRSQYQNRRTQHTSPPPLSVAIFVRSHEAVVVPLYFPVETTTMVGDRFSVSPLLTLFGSQHVTGLHITNQSASFLQQWGSFRSRTVLMRSVPRAFATAPPGQPASITQVRPVVDWLRSIDQAVVPHLPYPQHPVVLTGDPSLCTAFRAINVHRHLIDGGNQVDLTSRRLHQHIQAVAAVHHQERQASGLRDFYDTRAYSRHRTSLNPRDICTEASARRVQTLFVDERLIGALPAAPSSGDGARLQRPRPSNDEMCRVENAVVDTLSAGGTVHTIQGMRLPPGSHIAAVFRY